VRLNKTPLAGQALHQPEGTGYERPLSPFQSVGVGEVATQYSPIGQVFHNGIRSPQHPFATIGHKTGGRQEEERGVKIASAE
jgi:hypothetical protein